MLSKEGNLEKLSSFACRLGWIERNTLAVLMETYIKGRTFRNYAR